MNWDAIGAIGEVVGAFAVVITLIILIVQVRQNTRGLEVSNQLNRASTVDRHADSISRWRGRLIEDAELSRIWLAAINDEKLDQLELFRLNNLWIDFINTQRSNFVRSRTVGETGLSIQAVRSVAVETSQCDMFKMLWKVTLPWHGLSSPEFVKAVQDELDNMTDEMRDEFSASAVDKLPVTMSDIIGHLEKEQ